MDVVKGRVGKRDGGDGGGRNKVWKCYLGSLKIVWRPQEGIWFEEEGRFRGGEAGLWVSKWVSGWVSEWAPNDFILIRCFWWVILWLLLSSCWSLLVLPHWKPVNHIIVPTRALKNSRKWHHRTSSCRAAHISNQQSSSVNHENNPKILQSPSCSSKPSCLDRGDKDGRMSGVSVCVCGEDNPKSHFILSPLMPRPRRGNAMVVQQTETDSHRQQFDLWVKPVTIDQSARVRRSSLGRRNHIKKPQPDPG